MGEGGEGLKGMGQYFPFVASFYELLLESVCVGCYFMLIVSAF